MEDGADAKRTKVSFDGKGFAENGKRRGNGSKNAEGQGRDAPLDELCDDGPPQNALTGFLDGLSEKGRAVFVDDTGAGSLPSTGVCCRRCKLALWTVTDRRLKCLCRLQHTVVWSLGSNGKPSTETTLCSSLMEGGGCC